MTVVTAAKGLGRVRERGVGEKSMKNAEEKDEY